VFIVVSLGFFVGVADTVEQVEQSVDLRGGEAPEELLI
jgi:hypothetical protein